MVIPSRRHPRASGACAPRKAQALRVVRQTLTGGHRHHRGQACGRERMTTQSPTCGLGSSRRENDHNAAGRCTRPNAHGRRPSVIAHHQPGPGRVHTEGSPGTEFSSSQHPDESTDLLSCHRSAGRRRSRRKNRPWQLRRRSEPRRRHTCHGCAFQRSVQSEGRRGCDGDDDGRRHLRLRERWTLPGSKKPCARGVWTAPSSCVARGGSRLRRLYLLAIVRSFSGATHSTLSTRSAVSGISGSRHFHRAPRGRHHRKVLLREVGAEFVPKARPSATEFRSLILRRSSGGFARQICGDIPQADPEAAYSLTNQPGTPLKLSHPHCWTPAGSSTDGGWRSNEESANACAQSLGRSGWVTRTE